MAARMCGSAPKARSSKTGCTSRASGRFYTYDGAWENEHPTGGDLGAQETNAGSVTLYATPTEDLSIKLRHVRTVDDDGLAVQFLVKGENNNCGPFTTNGVTGTATYYCGTADPRPDLQRDFHRHVRRWRTRPTRTTWALTARPNSPA